MNVADDPALARNIASIAHRESRTLPGDRNAAREDLTQTLYLTAVEMAARFRGDHGAQLATYAFNALKHTAKRLRADLHSPVHHGKHTKHRAWETKIVEVFGHDRSSDEDRQWCTPDKAKDKGNNLDMLPSSEDPVSALEERDSMMRLRAVLVRSATRAVIELVFYEELSYQEAADRLGITISAVRAAVREFQEDAKRALAG